MFTDLREHIQQTFSAFDGYSNYDEQLTLWCYTHRAAQAEQRRSSNRIYYLKNRRRLNARTRSREERRAINRRYYQRHRAELLAAAAARYAAERKAA